MGYPDIFTRCVEVLLRLEGGYSNVTTDKGGETNFGLSKKSYPDLNIKTLTRDRAIEIYYNDYWIPMNISKIIEDDLVLHLFVFGVNAGIRTSIKVLQKLLGTTVDGFIGSETLKAIRDFNGNVVDEFIKREKLFYVTLAQKDESQQPNKVGWINRVNNTRF
jgi:lysozyme family protein